MSQDANDLLTLEGGGNYDDDGDAPNMSTALGLSTDEPPLMSPVALTTETTRSSELRQRVRPGDHGDYFYADYSQQQPPPPPPAAATPVVLVRESRVREWRGHAELWLRERFLRWEPVLEWWWRHKHVLRRAACGLVGLCLLVAWYAGSFADEAAYVADATRPSWARHGEPGIDFSAVSAELTCGELASGSLQRIVSPAEQPSLARLRITAEALLAGSDAACMCAPMVGTRRRYLAIRRAGAGGLVHLYNPVIDNDAAAAASDKSIVAESQRMLFPGRTEDVENVRANTVRISYRDDACQARAMLVHNEAAWCAQACIDLMNGRTVYDRAT